MSAVLSQHSNPSPSSSRSGAAIVRTRGAPRFRLDGIPDDALHAAVKSIAGRHNMLTAELLAHLAEVDARGIYRERACSSLYTYCIYELRLSEDEAQRRVRAARTARAFPVLFDMLAEGAIHLTGLLLLAPHLTQENHAGLLARARFRTKREVERLVAEFEPRPDVLARIEPLGPRPTAPRNSWQSFTASLRGPVRDLAPDPRWSGRLKATGPSHPRRRGCRSLPGTTRNRRVGGTCRQRSGARSGGVTARAARSRIPQDGVVKNERDSSFTTSARLRSAVPRRSRIFGYSAERTTRCSPSEISGARTCSASIARAIRVR
jgi:hypothetical protein